MQARLEAPRKKDGSTRQKNAALKKVVLILIIAILVVVLGAIACAVSLPFIIENRVKQQLDSLVTKEATITTETLMSRLEASSELVASKMTMVGVVEYDDEGVPVINKGDFVMIYKAEVKAGIDVKQVQFAVDNTERTVYIYVPDAQILDVKVLSDSVKYYNKGYALFNNDSHEDVVAAQKQAEEDAKKEAAETGITEVADNQSETLVRGILESVVEDYQMKFMRSEKALKAKSDEIKKAAEQAAQSN